MRPVRYLCPLCKQPVSLELYQKIMGILRKKEELSATQLQEKVRRAERLAQVRAEKRFNTHLKSLKKQLRASARAQLKSDRELIKQQEEKKYKRINRTFQNLLKDKQLLIDEQAGHIKELQRQLKRQTTPQLEGLLYEETLIRELRKRFSEDQFRHTGKGGDILHTVIRKNMKAGLIVYECKRVKTYSKKFVKQAFDAMNKRKADFAIVVTNAMKKGTQGFFVEKGVMVVHATGILSLATVVRAQVVRFSEMKLGRLEKDHAIKATLDYLEGPEFANSLNSIIQESISLAEDLMKEYQEHKTRWLRRYGSYKRMFEEALTVKMKSRALLSGEAEPKKVISKQALPALMQLPDVGK